MTDEVRARAAVAPVHLMGAHLKGAYRRGLPVPAILAPRLWLENPALVQPGSLSSACGHNERGQRSGVGCGHAVCAGGTEYMRFGHETMGSQTFACRYTY